MADPAVEQQVRDIICEKLSVSPDQVTPETSFVNDIGADSLDLVELIMELEDRFDTKIPDEEAEKILTVGDAIAYIDGAKSQAAAEPSAVDEPTQAEEAAAQSPAPGDAAQGDEGAAEPPAADAAPTEAEQANEEDPA